MTILPAYPLEISTDSLYNGKANESYWNKFYEDRSRTVTWSMELANGGALPEGLLLNATSGELTWKSPIAGKYNLKITATRGEESVSKVLKLIIEAAGGCKHTGKQHTERKQATCKENGMADYWYCDGCEKYFIDEQCKRQTSADMLDKLYTTAFHSDKNNDGKCDTCQKAMPIFKKVTNEDEITSCGMYLIVSKIGDKYYTFKAPEKDNMDNIEAMEITPNPDGTSFSYPKTDAGVMILKTEFAAQCGSLDAGKPRYSIGTTINGIPYSISGDDYSGYIDMYSYENSKYGYRMKLTADKYAEIASVYDEYWGTGEIGKGANCGVLTAFEGTKDGEPKRFFSFVTKEAYENEGIYIGNYEYFFYDANSLSTYPIELYKLTYAGEVNGKNYTLSDAQSMVTIGNEFTVIDSAGSKAASTVGGISEAVKTNYVQSVISEQTQITGDVSARTYADIKVKEEDSTIGEYEWNTQINSLVYEVTPMIEIKGNNSDVTYTEQINDEHFDGSEMTLSLCVGRMSPVQIIHHKTDGTKEYFYSEHSKNLKPGQKTFSLDEDYEKGNFVTFTVDSFSDIEILATEKSEKDNEISYGDGKLKITLEKGGDYTLILANYTDDERLIDVEFLTPKLVQGVNTITNFGEFTFANKSKVFLIKNLETMEPVCDECIITLE